MKISSKQKNAIFKVFFFGVIQILLFIIYMTVSSLAGNFVWTVEKLTTTPAGTIIQIINLIILINGILIFLYLAMFFIMFLSH